MSKSSLDLITQRISKKIGEEITKLGVQHRIFHRSKDLNSIQEKISRKISEGSPYSVDGKKMQDLFGVRIITYFQDDIPLVLSVLEKTFKFIDKEIDTPDLTVFKPKRTNIICDLLEEEKRLLEEFISDNLVEEYKLMDSTFELQLRTILSEGWHEIDHNLRYKCKEDWELHKEKERMLNGIYASLETNDIAMKNLFNELAYQHFKAQNWEALLRTKFRIKFRLSTLDDDIKNFLNLNQGIAKTITKLDRHDTLLELAKFNNNIPLTMSSFFYIINYTSIKDERIDAITPHIIKESLHQFYS